MLVRGKNAARLRAIRFSFAAETLGINAKLGDDGELEERRAHLSSAASAASRLRCELDGVGRGGRKGDLELNGCKEFGGNRSGFASSSVIKLGSREEPFGGDGISKELEERKKST